MSKRKRNNELTDETSTSSGTNFVQLAKAFDAFVSSLHELIELTPVENFSTRGLSNEVEDRVVIAKVLKRMRLRGQLQWMDQYQKNEDAHAHHSAETDSSKDVKTCERSSAPVKRFKHSGDVFSIADDLYAKIHIDKQGQPVTPVPSDSQWPPALPVIHNKALLKQAFTHRSYATVCAPAHSSTSYLTSLHNERLEFLGDSFLNHSVTKMLFAHMPDSREGEMSLLRAELIGNATAASFGKLYGFDKHLLLNDTAERDGVRKTPKVIADTFEAYLGALMLDGNDGIVRADKWLKALMSRRLAEYLTTKNDEPLDFYAKQKVWNHFFRLYPTMVEHDDGNVRPPIVLKYDWVDGGGGNEGGFIVAAKLWVIGQGIEGQEIGRGFGLNKKEAEHRAAMDVLKKLGI